MPPIVRFAPSPTGYLHVGNIRTALVNWLFARRHGGTFLLRIDDTDTERSRPEYETALREDLRWLGLDWDREARQADRMDAYAAAREQLLASGRLYACYETAEELAMQRKMQLSRGVAPVYNRAALHLSAAERAALEAQGRTPHYRFRLEDTPVAWDDLVRGPVRFEGRHTSDPVLLRADGMPTYTLSSVVDDLAFGITHIIRGEDHVSNTAVQVQLFQALSGGSTVPAFAHLALIRTTDGELSKREGGGDVRSLRAAGVEAGAITSLLARLGTSLPVEAHATLEPLVSTFDFATFGRAPATYDPAELMALSTRLVHSLPFAQAQARLHALGLKEADASFWEGIRANLTQVADAHAWWDICRGALAPPALPEEDRAFLQSALESLPPEPWDGTTWQQWTTALKTATGRKGKALFLPLRLALTGMEHGPELATLLPVLTRAQAVERLRVAAG